MASALLGAFGLLLFAHLEPAPDEGGEGLRSEIRRLIQNEWIEGRQRDRQVSEHLAGFGDAAVPVLLDLHAGRDGLDLEEAFARVNLRAGARPDRLSDLALLTLSRLSPQRVLKELTLGAHAGDSDSSFAALEVLSVVGSAKGLDLFWELVEGWPAHARRRGRVRVALVDTLASILRRDARALWDLEAFLTTSERIELSLEAVDSSRHSDAAQALSSWLGRDAAMDGPILKLLGQIEDERPWNSSADLSALLQQFLKRKKATARGEAVVALGKLRDPAAGERLAWLLEDPDPHVRLSAAWSLERISGSSKRLGRDAWLEFFAAEQRWWEETGLELLARLHEGNAAARLAVARELLAHPIHRHEIADQLVAAMLADPDFARLAPSLLVELDSRRVVPDLVKCLRRPEPGVQGAALGALQALTGERRGANPAAWDTWLRGK